MPGRGPAPKTERARPHKPERGEWVRLEEVGWQHGAVPEPPEGIGPNAVEAWRIWLGSWMAAHWGPEDLPALLTLIALYDDVMDEGKLSRAGELRLEMEAFGLTPKARQDRRWHPPEILGPAKPKSKIKAAKHRTLRAVDETA